jgi:hypothetical protein
MKCHEVLTQRALFHAESAFRDACRTSSELCCATSVVMRLGVSEAVRGGVISKWVELAMKLHFSIDTIDYVHRIGNRKLTLYIRVRPPMHFLFTFGS